ncbi:hypothetical protein N474_25150 [Pseudoalteromonas luteoviolacea CPMOR-2]|uniref:Lipoprotein n=1 Tax=Pseudoalteromonas luteoviolacea DSM 6061 TaxID=1365250 RepID=A0A162A8C2_9GAMM|nr:hypothetical protein [Pseudoalteromonas luteoviolacea]KZN45753.1 hypothetical protein N475_25775 [Pseudoalteromonas luteoviolacea DSM 6061]KZN48913.1 hypothetical protein N474_25150 [Pseudoalteromonas luteoviolacea CPMOR-2]MBE0389475.1 hypothetical protein [Pseudoalteromonas luteoviolacea DSM 6061]
MKNLFLTLIALIGLTACLSNTVRWDGSYNKLSEYGKSCALSWVDNIYSIDQTKQAISALEGKPNKLIILKSGSSGIASYHFVAIMEMKKRFISIVSSPRYEKAIITEIDKNTFDQIMAYVELNKTDEGKIYKGNTSNLSHVPCDFIYYKSEDKTFKQAYIGLFKDGDNMAQLIKNHSENFAQHGRLLSESASSPIPSEYRMEEIRKEVKKNVFFELDYIF